MIVSAGVPNTSFAAGRAALLNLARLDLTAKPVERVTERIGPARVEQRHEPVQAFLDLPLLEQLATAVAQAPDLAVMSMDGGRLPIRDWPAGEAAEAVVSDPAAAAGPRTDPASAAAVGGGEPGAGPESQGPAAAAEAPAAEPRHGHWREDKIGLLRTRTSQESAVDPCPTIPATVVDPLRILKLARELRKGGAATEDAVTDPLGSEPAATPEGPGSTPPEVKVKSMVATRQGVAFFGPILAAAARARGFYQARRQAFVSDGAEANRGLQRRWFSDFVALLDFIHELSDGFAAAMAGRGFATGWEVEVRWIRLVWQGRLAEVIAELERWQAELGMPADGESEGSSRRVVADTLRYLKNHQDQMRYNEYRRQGLPITSSQVESTVKQFHRRVTGREKFWTERGAEALLQFRADSLSETEPIEKFWQEREDKATGRRCYRRAV